jgi:hypothetical protein
MGGIEEDRLLRGKEDRVWLQQFGEIGISAVGESAIYRGGSEWAN